jgi:hypothetical protein
MRFNSNDRVRFSELGRERNPRLKDKCGVILSSTKTKHIFLVLLAGNKTPTRLHATYLELAEPEE